MRYVPIFDDVSIRSDLARLRHARQLLATANQQGLLDQADARCLRLHLKSFARQLRRIGSAAASGNSGKTHAEVQGAMTSYAAKVSAVILDNSDTGALYDASDILARAKRINLFAPCTDPVRVDVKEKENGGHRLIHQYGWRHRARQWIARCVLIAAGVGSEYDFNTKGIGSVEALKAMCVDVEAGFRFWVVADINNCFPTVKPGHLHDLMPIDAKALSSVIFVSENVPIQLFCDGIPINSSILEKEARLGLAQGSKLSPLLVSALLGRELRALVPEANPALCIVDDIAIGAHVKSEAEGFGNALCQRLTSLEAGPLQLKHCHIYDAREGILFVARKIRLRTANYATSARITLTNQAHDRMFGRACDRFGSKLLDLANDEQSNELDHYIERSIRGYGLVPTPSGIADLKTRMVLKAVRNNIWGAANAS